MIGSTEASGPDGIAIRDTGRADVLAFDVVGKVTREDMQRLSAALERVHEEQGKVRLLMRLDGFPQIEVAALIDKLKLMRVVPWIERYAIVGPDWLEFEVKALAPLVGFDLEHFDILDGEEAEAWLIAD